MHERCQHADLPFHAAAAVRCQCLDRRWAAGVLVHAALVLLEERIASLRRRRVVQGLQVSGVAQNAVLTDHPLCRFALSLCIRRLEFDDEPFFGLEGALEVECCWRAAVQMRQLPFVVCRCVDGRVYGCHPRAQCRTHRLATRVHQRGNIVLFVLRLQCLHQLAFDVLVYGSQHAVAARAVTKALLLLRASHHVRHDVVLDLQCNHVPLAFFEVAHARLTFFR